MSYMLILMPLIGAIIGWGTNTLAIYLLFHPRKPVKILFWKVQGLIPKRQEEIASKIAEVVATKLLNDPLIEIKKRKKDIVDYIMNQITEELINKINDKPALAVVGMFIKKETISNMVLKLKDRLDNLIENLAHKVSENIDIEHQICEKVANYKISELEKVIKDISHKELKTIEILGGILGFIIGLVQAICVIGLG